jgi:hypothetical protein
MTPSALGHYVPQWHDHVFFAPFPPPSCPLFFDTGNLLLEEDASEIMELKPKGDTYGHVTKCDHTASIEYCIMPPHHDDI